ncbi:40S ribosomal protein [Hypoxylon texense]
MPGCSPSPNLGRILFFTTIFIFGLLIAVSVWNCVTYYTPDDSSSSTDTSTLIEQPLAQDDEPQSQYAERGVGVGSLSHIFPSPIFVPDVPTTWKSNATSDSNSIAFITNSSSVETSGTLSLSNAQPTLSITVQPEPTSSEIAALAENLGSLLDGAIPLAAPSIIREATSEAQVLAVSVEAIATDIASIAGEVEASQLQAPNALKTAEGLLESLDAEVGSIAKDVTPTSGFPAPVLDELSKAMTSDLGGIVKVANGPVSLVGNLIEDNICETTIIVGNIPSTVVGLCGDMTSATGGSAPASIVDSPTSNTQSSLTTEVSSSAIFPTTMNDTSETTALASSTPATLASLAGSGSTLPISSPGSASQTSSPISPSAAGSSSIETDNQGSKPVTGGSYLTTMTRPPSTASTKPRIGTSSRVTTTGTDEIVTITESITVTEDCAVPPIRSVFLVGQTSTLTIYAYNACPTPSPCPECPSPTCHCPEAGGVPSTTSPPGGNGAQGPCPGSGPQPNLLLVALAGHALIAMEAGSVFLIQRKVQTLAQSLVGLPPIAPVLSRPRSHCPQSLLGQARHSQPEEAQIVHTLGFPTEPRDGTIAAAGLISRSSEH